MNYKFLVLVLVFVVQQQITVAQTVKIIHSTEQDWAGGIAGHTGENYTFEIEFSDYVQEPTPVALWIGNGAFTRITHDPMLLQD